MYCSWRITILFCLKKSFLWLDSVRSSVMPGGKRPNHFAYQCKALTVEVNPEILRNMVLFGRFYLYIYSD
jgi:hypothetical protein